MDRPLKTRHLFSVLLALGVMTATPAAGPLWAKTYCERLYESARKDYYALLDSDRKQRFHDNWDKVIDKFAAIVDQYPECPRAPDSLFNAGVLYRKLYRKSWVKKDLESALNSFKELNRQYPKNKLADDALLAAAQIQEELGDRGAAYITYSDLVKRYPKGDMAGEARQKIKLLAAYAPRRSPRPAKRSGSAAVRVTDIKYWSNPDYTRVVVYGTGRFEYSANQLRGDSATGKPPRMYIDLDGAVVPQDLCSPITISDGLLLRTRMGQYDRDTVRLVLDIDSIEDHRVFTMENPSRLVVDVIGKQGKFTGTSSRDAETGRESPLPLAQQLGLGVRTIVLDPGHGGKDPGAIGPGGLKEKDVTLALARRLKPLLEDKGYQILMTRDSDTYVELDARTAFANKQRADLFISIHTNASRSRSVRGVETYFLGVARDREASETALLENAISEQTLADLDLILLDLARTSNLKQSSVLAESIQDNLYRGLANRHSRVRNNGVKQAAFYVLIGAQMPAVLVETSFISNPESEKLLSSQEYRDLISDSIFRGIIHYIQRLASVSSRDEES
ncbi:MAG: N-acetylmuramoyl-L-alanine amidase [bacterium]|nr:MAG: N-acetylmuramoyl-L-alanine amidase [bacterium]